ncbi:MAG: phage major capsid protein [Bacteroidales bacterium]|nr:phage major capsid protein [Bacteroidales bacterium]
MKQITKSDLGLDLTKGSEEQRAVLDSFAEMTVNAVNKALDGALDKEGIEKEFKGISEMLSKFDAAEFAQLKEDNASLCEQVKSLGDSIAKLQQKGFAPATVNNLDEEITSMLESPKFKDFMDGRARYANGFQIKAISLAGNYTGDNNISQNSPVVSSTVNDKISHIRDFAVVLQGDPEYPNITFQQVYDIDKNAQYVGENGVLPESALKVKEVTAETARVGTSMTISKRMLKSRIWLRSYLLNKLTQAVLDAEDTGVLFGSGIGNDLKGITKYDGVQTIEGLVSNTISSGDVTKIERVLDSDNNCVQVIAHLAAADDLVQEGMKITFSGFAANGGTASNMNTTFDVIKLNDTQILLEGAESLATAYDATTTAQTAIKYTVKHGAYHSIASPNSIDALEVAVAIMNYGNYHPTVIVVNPITLCAIRSEKNTTGDRLDVVKDLKGNPIIAGLRVMESTSIPVGKYFIGDFREGANIVEYSGLTLDWAEDVTTKKSNTVVLIAQEELIVPVYNPFAFAYGKLSDLKTAIKAS